MARKKARKAAAKAGPMQGPMIGWSKAGIKQVQEISSGARTKAKRSRAARKAARTRARNKTGTKRGGSKVAKARAGATTIGVKTVGSTKLRCWAGKRKVKGGGKKMRGFCYAEK